MTGRLKNLEDLLEYELGDLYSAEIQLLDAIPEMIESAMSTKLQAAFEVHLEETKNHIQRLEQIAQDLKLNIRGNHCVAMRGMIINGQEMIQEKTEEPVHDAGLIAVAQRIEHYEIAGYGTVVTYLGLLKYDNAKDTLTETLREEKTADEKLTRIAREINVEAVV